MSKQASEIYVLYDREMGVTLHGSQLPAHTVSVHLPVMRFRLTVSLVLFPKSLSN